MYMRAEVGWTSGPRGVRADLHAGRERRERRADRALHRRHRRLILRAQRPMPPLARRRRCLQRRALPRSAAVV